MAELLTGATGVLLSTTGTDEAPETDAVEKRVEVNVSMEVEGPALLTGATGLLLATMGTDEAPETDAVE